MNDSLYDSFRWLDKDTDLDLSLDGYQQQTPPNLGLSQRRRPSFRRTLSFNSVNLSRKSTSLASFGRTPISSPPIGSQSALAGVISRRSSISRPSSKSNARHASQASTSTIDPSAQYYHDPEARLKLRVYLASPQRFDEAIEFGFPAPKETGNMMTSSAHPGSNTSLSGFSGTFLDVDDASLRGEKKDVCSNISRLSYVMENSRDSRDLPTTRSTRHSWLPQPERTPLQTPDTREMTLRMTLTRPDLRADSSVNHTLTLTPTSTSTLTTEPNPFLTGKRFDVFEQGLEDQNLVKKMWRKLCRRKYP
ncbi:hypothetical protein BJY04DRAFT_115491 [Aspergillus karnatakaensis]|uniref:uncharacterized protein n=1 Tax=Aspergillus karnatakaensis TaxID=1810916 RepID=UPI003CCCDBD5